jgi:hypothetical protein
MAVSISAQFDGAGRGGHDLSQGRTAAHLPDLLGKIADHGLAGLGDLALIRLLFGGDQPKNRGLAGPVRPDQAGAGIGEDLKAGVPEEDLGAVLPGEVIEMDHGCSVKKRRKLAELPQSEKGKVAQWGKSRQACSRYEISGITDRHYSATPIFFRPG